MKRLCLILIFSFLITSQTFAQESDDTRYTVQVGDNLFQIAQEFGVTVRSIAEANDLDNIDSLSVGDVLIIPNPQRTPPSVDSDRDVETESPSEDTEESAGVTETPSTPAPEARSYLVQDGDSLYTIAGRFEVTVQAIAQANNITDYNRIAIGQRLQIPSGVFPLAPPNPNRAENNVEDSSADDDTEEGDNENLGTGGATIDFDKANDATSLQPIEIDRAGAVGYARGIQIIGNNSATYTATVSELGLGWVKQTIDWNEFEPTQGEIDFSALDAIITPLDNANLNILLTVVNAPDWARQDSQGIGPADLDSDYATFVGEIAANYASIVDAYEVWSQPNIASQWNGRELSADSYANLLKRTYNAIKSADPAARVISAGLAQTETNDGINAINDREYLAALYEAGIANFTDGIGVQAQGWANPPDSTCCENNRPSVAGWDDRSAFFFLDTLDAYRDIMNESDDSSTFLWVTNFGWGSAEDLNGDVNPVFGYVTYTDLREQSQYIARAFQLGQELTYVGPMFLSNLNGCTVANSNLCYWSLLDRDGEGRPAFDVLRAAP